jgi:hypothetical protein
VLPVLLLLALQEAPPAGQLILEGGTHVTRVLTVRAQVRALPSASPGLQMRLSTDPKAPAVWVPFAERTIVELPPGDGDKKVTLRLRDAKGVESAPVEAVIRLDTTPPVANIKAPERVEGSSVRAVFDVPDAVALQHTEDLSAWSPWEPYSTPRLLPLSKGPGKKLLFVRFRDEAGNESLPGRIVVEAESASPSADPGALRDMKVAAQRALSGALRLRVWVEGAALIESRVLLDGTEMKPRGPQKKEEAFDIGSADGPRHVLVEAWDAAGAAFRGEAVFMDRDAPTAPSPETPETTTRPGWNIGLKAGVLPSGVKLDSSTPTGLRTIKPGPMAAVRLEGGYAFDGLPFLMGSLEFDEGKDVSVMSLGIEFGLDFSLGQLFDTDLRGILSAGGFASRIDTDPGSFADFKTGFGARAAAGVQARLLEQLWMDLTVDFRFAEWQLEGKILRGDESARMLGAGILLGLSWRF